MNKLQQNFFIDFENTSAETHAKVLAALQAELDEARSQKRIPIWDKGLERLSNPTGAASTGVSHTNTVQ